MNIINTILDSSSLTMLMKRYFKISFFIVMCLCTVIETLVAQEVIVEGDLIGSNMSIHNDRDSIVVWLNTGLLGMKSASAFIGTQGLQGLQGLDGVEGPQGTNGVEGVGGDTRDSTGIIVTGDGSIGNPYEVKTTGHYVGEFFGGGIVYYTYSHHQHGLILSLRDLDDGSGITWGSDTLDVPDCENMMDGKPNTDAIVAAGGQLFEPGGLCDTFSGGGFTDWYLPSNFELKEMDISILIINDRLETDGDPDTKPLDLSTPGVNAGTYWSSTETGSGSVFVYFFRSGSAGVFHNKVESYRVRAVRAF